MAKKSSDFLLAQVVKEQHNYRKNSNAMLQQLKMVENDGSCWVSSQSKCIHICAMSIEKNKTDLTNIPE